MTLGKGKDERELGGTPGILETGSRKRRPSMGEESLKGVSFKLKTNF